MSISYDDNHYTTGIYIYIYICVCVCVCVCRAIYPFRKISWKELQDKKKISNKVIKFITEAMEKKESGIAHRRKTLTEVEIQRGIFQGGCAFIITICNSNDATQLHTEKMHRLQQIYLTARKDQSPNVYGGHEAVCKKKKRIGDNMDILSGYRNEIWHRKVSHAY